MKRESTPESDIAYRYLHRAIVRGEILPKQRLIELELAEQLSVGRAAIRTALVRLVQDGLVVHVPHRGAHVRYISVEEAIEMIETRAVLEGLAARQAAQRISEEDVATLNSILEQMKDRLFAGDLVGYSDGNADLHDLVVRLSGNGTLMRTLERLQANHVRFQYRMVLMPNRAQQSLREHQAVIDAIIAKDPQRAEGAMRRHLNKSAEQLRQRLNSIPTE